MDFICVPNYNKKGLFDNCFPFLMYTVLLVIVSCNFSPLFH